MRLPTQMSGVWVAPADAAGITAINSTAGLAVQWLCQTQLMQRVAAAPSPVCMTLGLDRPSQPVSSDYAGTGQVRAYAQTEAIAAAMSGGAAYGLPSTTIASLVMEYGQGSIVQRVEADWKPGSYQLPSCEWIRVGVRVRYLGAELAAARFTASLSPAYAFAFYPLTYTALESVNIATNFSVFAPEKSRAVEAVLQSWSMVGLPGATEIVISGAAVARRVYDSAGVGVFAPPWSPVDLSAPVGGAVSNVAPVRVDIVGAAFATVYGLRFFLSL